MTDEDSVVFSKLTYLGCASVNAPRSEVEALRMMSILRGQCQISLDVTLSVPNVSEGTVRYGVGSSLCLAPLESKPADGLPGRRLEQLGLSLVGEVGFTDICEKGSFEFVYQTLYQNVL